MVGDQILVITDKGRVFGHRLEGDIIHAGVELTRPGQSVTGGNRDRWVLGMGNDLVIVAGEGRVVTYAVTTSTIVGPTSSGPQGRGESRGPMASRSRQPGSGRQAACSSVLRLRLALLRRDGQWAA